MSEELDQAATAFTTEIAPASRPRDVAGSSCETRGAPESMFGPREVEGGDDAGDDPGRRSREVEVRRGNQRQTDRDDDNDDVHGTKPQSLERVGDRDVEPDDGELSDEERAVVEAGDREAPERRKRDDEDEKYEVVVDGHPFEVTLGEALNGYVRQETFHRRLGELNQLRSGPRGGSSASAIELAADHAGQGGLRERRPDDDAARAGLGSRVRDQPERGAPAAKDLPGFVRRFGALAARAGEDGADPRAGGG